MMPDEASISTLREVGVANLDHVASQQHWAELASASTAEEAATAWLHLLCGTVPGARQGVIALARSESAPQPVAHWPGDATQGGPLLEFAAFALPQDRGVMDQGDDGLTYLAYPISTQATPYGIAAVAVASTDPAVLRTAMRQLQWGVAWLRDLLRRQQLSELAGGDLRTAEALDVMSDIIGNKTCKQASQALVVRLVNSYGLERSSIGFFIKQKTRVETISHSAGFGKQMNLVRLIGQAMDEAIEQRVSVLYPTNDEQLRVSTRAHEELARTQSTGELLTIPLMDGAVPVGALHCELPHDRSFSQDAVDTIDCLAAFAGPLLSEKREADKSFPVKAWDAIAGIFKRVFGPRYPGTKLALIGFSCLMLFLTLYASEYRVTTTGHIEGLIQRSIVTPFDGFVFEAPVRSGDFVKKGALLARLDDRDLALERLKWISERQERQLQYDQALSARDLSQIRVRKAQIEQAGVQLELIDAKLARAKLAAPFDGIIVTGDLSQSIGAAVRRGDVLFEIAPLNAYRLILGVDETQVFDVNVGDKGQFLTSSLTDVPFDFSVEKITPVVEVVDGRALFQVEARIDGDIKRLRPGMKGVGKVDAGRRSLFWIYSRPLMNWLRLATWRWIP